MTAPTRPANLARTTFASLVAFALLALPPAAAGAAQSPWWQLSSASRPAHIQPGFGQNEVRKLVVHATSGEYLLQEPTAIETGHTEEGVGYVEVPFDADAGEIEEALEELYGAGNVEVSTGPDPAEYLITFKGELEFQPVRLSAGGEVILTRVKVGRADGEIFVVAENLGDAAVDGKSDPVTITDTLPPGLRSIAASASSPDGINGRLAFPCGQSPATPSCSFGNAPAPGGVNNHTLFPYDVLEMRIAVVAEPGAESDEENTVRISGGKTPPASLSRSVTLSPEATPFGLDDLRMHFEREGGGTVTQAGSHPFQFTTTVAINEGPATNGLFEAEGPPTSTIGVKAEAESAALAKDIYTKLPVGVIGNPTAIPTCSLAKFLTDVGGGAQNACPAQSSVGVTSVTVHEPTLIGQSNFIQSLQNLEIYPGEPARLGFYIGPAHLPIVLDTSLRSGEGEGALPGTSEDYGINVNVTNIVQTAGLSSARVSVWGVPGDARHDGSRSSSCLRVSRGENLEGQRLPPCQPAGEAHPPAFFTMPTSCTGPLQGSVEGDAWIDPRPAGQRETLLPTEPLPALDSCNQLSFNPSIESEPTTNAATSPTGLSFTLNVPNEGLENAEGLASSEIKRAVVTLPQGFTTNPSVAEGLAACTLAEFKATTLAAKSGCTEESKIGDTEIESPVVNQTVKGSLFVAQQHNNPYNNLLTLYLVFKNQELGILVKQALKVVPDPVTGQLTTEVDNIPQLPFSHFKLAFRQGQRSPLVSPPACGTYAVKAKLYPWSEPDTPLERESSFLITEGPEGNPCPTGGLPPFHPVLEAGTLNNAAGTFSPFVTKITRKDSEQEITHFSIKLPPGVVGKLAGVGQCSDAAIAAAKAREHEGGGQEELNSPSCPVSSEVGRTLVGSGVGNILAYAPGKLYLAGPYHGSNLSLVAITAAKVGPFDLGTVVVRFALRINPETAEVFVDATGSDPIPHIVDGIPVHLRDVRSYVDRPNFTLNPTNCTRTSTASTVLGSGLDFASEVDDRPITVTSPFQAADCAALPFKPRLALSLKGGTHRGAHPAFKAVLNMNGIGEAGVARTQVTLPRSEFIENAHFNTICTRTQFKEGGGNGEKCPAGSVYGKARAVTPILGEPLSGPIFLRSSEHKLPDVVVALHNAQVDVVLDGRVDSVKGQLRNTFESTPDAPVSQVVLELDGGKKGLFVNSTDLCAATHRAIADFTGQNGKEHDFNPVVKASGCKGKAKKKQKKSKREAR